MRRLHAILLLGTLALSTAAFAPAPPTPDTRTSEAPAPAVEQQREIILCVKFRDWEVPATGITWEAPYERFCVEAPDVKVPFPGGNPAPEVLPGEQA